MPHGVRAGDTLVVWKLDRLGQPAAPRRPLMVCIRLAPASGFKRAGASIDTTTPAGKLIFGIFALAEYERELIRERTMAGLCLGAARAGRGRPFMTPAENRYGGDETPETQTVNCAPNSDQPSDAVQASHPRELRPLGQKLLDKRKL